MERALRTEQEPERLAEAMPVGEVDESPAVAERQDRRDQRRDEHATADPHRARKRLAAIGPAPPLPEAKRQQHEPADAAERERRQLRPEREPEREPEHKRVAPAPVLEPAQRRVKRKQARRGGRDVERCERAVAEHDRGRRGQERREQRTATPQHRPPPHVGHDDEEREERQGAGAREREVERVVAAPVEDREAFRLAVGRRLALRARAGEIGPDRECEPRERWMLDVVDVVSAVEEHKPGREVLGLVPGLVEHVPGRGREPDGQQRHERERDQRRRAGGRRHAR